MVEETKITTVKKVKNPKRVEQGKRLAAISREAKARKAEERAKVTKCVENANMFYLAVGSAAAIGLAYGTYVYFFKKGSVEVQRQIEVQKVEKKKNPFETL